MSAQAQFQPGSIVSARGREWVVLPQTEGDILHLRPVGSGEDTPTIICAQLEQQPVKPATFPHPSLEQVGSQTAGLLLRDALMLKLRNGAGPFRSFGNIAIEPRAYQLVPLMMALKQETIRLLIADDVGVGKTIEAGLIAREFIDRGEIDQLSVLCPPHLCEQWQEELKNRFHIDAVIVRTSSAARLERGLPHGSSVFSEYPFTIVSLDYIKSKVRRDAFAEQCPNFVIVDEAHTCSRSGQGRQLRYELLRDLSQSEHRHMVLLTATPHSGDEEAFYNLLGLLRSEFADLKNIDNAQHPLRQQLADHFIQRRREDIKEWQEGDVFPDRFTAETTYTLTGEWNAIFQEVLDYARELVEREEEGTLRARMNWWAALALLRCISSSPQAAIRALQTRISNAASDNEEEQLEELEAQGQSSVLDGSDEMGLTNDDVEPGAALDEDLARLQSLIERAKSLRADGDPKLGQLVNALKDMLKEEQAPVVFCRYIATAHYLGEELAKKFTTHHVEVITGELTPTEREEKILSLKEIDKPVFMVATDCLSEGINLQEQFTAVVHYDLSWNPTRHEQREGRVDRFGQKAKQVKALMLYGNDNPIDGAVLQVILRKADAIRKATGVSVPMPEDDNRITQAILNTVLLHKSSGNLGAQGTADMFAEDQDLQALDASWESAREKASQNYTKFAQRRLKPEDVMPEWDKAFSVLGTEQDVARFVDRACQKLGTPLEPIKKGGYKIPLQHMPTELKERLDSADLLAIKKIDFTYPSATGAEFVHRTHPLVSIMADYLAEAAMSGEATDLVARAGAVFTQNVSTKTTVFLLRVRSRLTLTRTDDARDLLAEEALAVAIQGSNAPELLDSEQALQLMASEVSKNIGQRRDKEITSALDRLYELQPIFNQLAEARADGLLADHRRVRDAAEAKGRYAIEPQLPVDVMGVFVLVPDVALV